MPNAPGLPKTAVFSAFTCAAPKPRPAAPRPAHGIPSAPTTPWGMVLFSLFQPRLSYIFILIAVFLPRAAPRPGLGRAGPCGCCPPAAAAGNGGGSGPAPGRACRPYVRPLCKRPARSAPPRPPRERRSPRYTIALRMNGEPGAALRPRPGWDAGGHRRSGGRGSRPSPPWGESRPVERALPAGGGQDVLPGSPGTARASSVGGT